MKRLAYYINKILLNIKIPIQPGNVSNWMEIVLFYSKIDIPSSFN